ncbi:hypothetical protein LTR84_011615 [Exophiala bonariae]|uniref:Zn(2)-C6 fungal-type domain-containing protein n=1 Tax=Exophiala bonariae TaxID=1690606 RepID=A0AAV9NGG9_9EURO|nr:hypothetical protein LTR84_011615 [Exophiala bonariae]
MIVQHINDFLGHNQSTTRHLDYKSTYWERYRLRMRHEVGGGHAPISQNPFQPGLPSFQQLLSTIEIQIPQDRKPSGNTSVAIDSAIPYSRGFQYHNYNVAARTAFHSTSGKRFQSLDKRSDIHLSGPNRTDCSPNMAHTAMEAHKSNLYALSTLDSPRLASHNASFDQASSSASNSIRSPLELKLWHEATQIFPLNEKIAFTKTGKLRKRLEKACDPCREKKVKCRLRLPKCIHCQKCGYECNAELILRPDSTGTSLQSSNQSPIPTGVSDTKGSSNQPNISKQNDEQDFSGLKSEMSSTKAPKRLRNETPTEGDDVLNETLRQPPQKKRMTTAASTMSLGTVVHDELTTKSETSLRSPSMAALPTVLNFSLYADPYDINPRVTLKYIGKFFGFVDKHVLAAIPKAPFLQWVKSCKHKSQSDKMMIYSVLALGSVFADISAANTYTSDLSTIVHEGLTLCGEDLSFQLAMTYLLTTLLSAMRGEYHKAWATCGSTMHTLFGLRFNTEAGIRTTSRSGSWEAQLETDTLMESRRSITWAALVVECLNGCYTTPLSTAAWSEYDLWLPLTKIPFQFHGSLDLANLSPPQEINRKSFTTDALGDSTPLFHLIHLATIFHEVTNYAHQQKSRVISNHRPFQSEIERRLHMLKRSLHRFQEYGGNKIMFFDLEILYHCINLHLHRYIRHGVLNSSEIETHVTTGLSHAYRILERVQYLNSDEKMRNSLAEFRITSPCLEFAITAALDVLTAAGKFNDLTGTSNIMSMVASGLEVLDDLARYSQSAKQRRDLVKRRLTTMLQSITRRTGNQRKAFYFKDPLLLRFGMEQDVIYGITRIHYFQALDSREAFTDDDFHELKDSL